MTTPAIRVDHLRKLYVVPEREAGLRASIRSLVRRRSREVKAVDDISFEIAPGEMVGFLGPNGAGKTTTLKMLSGLLHPSGGSADVLGFAPQSVDGSLNLANVGWCGAVDTGIIGAGSLGMAQRPAQLQRRDK